jgi:hypothetical protein
MHYYLIVTHFSFILIFTFEREEPMTRKETLKNEIVMKMRYHLGKNELAMLDETLSECLYQIEIVDATTLPATVENSNEYILELYELKRSLILKESRKYVQAI